MSAKLFETALGIGTPWSVTTVEFDEAAKVLTVLVDFEPGTRFSVSGEEGVHPVHDTLSKTYRHLNFFRHECHLQVRTPRVKLPNGSVRLVEPEFAGRLSGFTLLFEALRQRQAAGLVPEAGEGVEPERYGQLLFEWAYPEVAAWCRREGRPYPALDGEGAISEALPRTLRLRC